MTDLDHDDLIANQLRHWADDLATQVEPYAPPITIDSRTPATAHGRRLALVGIAAAVATVGLAAVVFHDSPSDLIVASPTTPETTAAVTDSSAPQSTSSTQWFSDRDRVTNDALTSGAWEGGSVSADGMTITIHFTGPAPYSPTDPCSADYRAEVVETSDAVTIRVDRRSPEPPTAEYPCFDLGFARTVEARLRSPLAGRAVVALGSERFVGDPASSAEATAIPDGWRLVDDTRQITPFGTARHTRTWKPTSDDGDGCIAGDFITLAESDRYVTGYSSSRAVLIEIRDIDGRQVSLWQGPPPTSNPLDDPSDPTAEDVHLTTWQTMTTTYTVWGPATCVSGEDMPFDGLLEFVRGMRTPAPTTASLGFTLVRLAAPPDGYRAFAAHYSTVGVNTVLTVQYIGGDGEPGLTLVLNPDAATLADLVTPEPQRWTVGGRTVYAVGDGCTVAQCAVAVQWDDRTVAMLMWTANGTEFSSGLDQASLVPLLGSLQVAPKGFFEPGAVAWGSTYFQG